MWIDSNGVTKSGNCGVILVEIFYDYYEFKWVSLRLNYKDLTLDP